MGFDLKKFKTAEFKCREKKIPVPFLKDFFDDKEKPEFIIKNIEGEKLYEVRAAVERNRNIEEIVKQLSSGNVKEKVEAALKALGVSGDLPDDYVRDLRTVIYGVKYPELDLEAAKKISKEFSVFFSNLATEIRNLSGLGSKLGESKSSGTTRKSG